MLNIFKTTPPTDAQPRRAKLTILLGFNGTGKTTMLRRIVTASAQRTLIVTPDDVEWTDLPINELQSRDDYAFQGIQRHIWNPDNTLDRISKFKKGILVFDDCRSYFQDHTAPRVRDLLIRRRQREVDVFACGHGFTQVPPVFFTFASDYILFRTVDNIDRRRDCITNFEFLKQSQAFVNHKAKTDPHFFRHIKIS